jgi:hypothetical protein
MTYELDRRPIASHDDLRLPERGTPGRSTLTSRHVMRAPRDERGVAAGADLAVERAAGGSGAALPGELRERFEASLGADLSAVRVHTGAASQEAAASVGARAYATGNDIHFAAGQYDPTSSDGQFLIAHEVAHTVQQSGGAPVRQNKLEISTPGDTAELEADRAAEAMVEGAVASVTPRSREIARTDDPFSDMTVREGPDGNDVVHPDWTPQQTRRYNDTFEGVEPAYEVNWAGQISSDESGVPAFDAVLEFDDDSARRVSAYYYLKNTTGECKAVDHPMGGRAQPEGCYDNATAAVQGETGTAINAITAAWQQTRGASSTAKAAIDRYDNAAKDPALNGLTGTGSAITKEMAENDPMAEATPTGVLQKGTIDQGQPLDQAVKSAQPMTGSGGTTIGQALTTDDADKGAAKITPDVQLQKKVTEWKAAEAALEAVTRELSDAQDDQPARSAVASAQNALKKAQGELASKQNEENQQKVEQTKSVVTNLIDILAKVLGAKAAGEVAGDVVGYVVGLGFDAQINTYKNSSAAIATEAAKLDVAEAKAAVDAAQKELAGQATKMIAFKNKVVAAEDKRRLLLNELGDLAKDNALKNNADPKQAAAVQAKIKALPAVEVVIAATQQVLNAISIPGYTPASGIGASVVANLDAMTAQLGKLEGARTKYTRTLGEWQAKKAEVQRFISNVM